LYSDRHESFPPLHEQKKRWPSRGVRNASAALESDEVGGFEPDEAKVVESQLAFMFPPSLDAYRLAVGL
jgi:hypothetical protein